MNRKAVIAMSGGVDSSVAAWLMKERGCECIGITLKLYTNDDIMGAADAVSAPVCKSKGCCSLEDINDARAVAYRLGMPHYVLNFTEAFRGTVIRKFIETYERGATPNPCIDCNRYIKFDKLLLRVCRLDFDTLVTGHYARIERDGLEGRWLLKKAADPRKDQSYVLYCLTQEQLAYTRFPLGELTKVQVREIAREQGFANAKKHDSQDICFVPDRDYGGFIERYTGKISPPGDIIGTDGSLLGRHRGIVRYTIGQRRGLGVACNEPVYVAAKSPADNSVTLGPDSALFAKALIAEDLNFIAYSKLERPLRVTAKTRYLQTEQSATAEQTGEDTLRVEFDKPQRAITPGQAVVLYDEDTVIGGGTIREAV
jgi:tRNA-specific 2-thiouridylase